MIKRVKEIMKIDFIKVDILNSVKNVIDLSLAHKQDYFPVFDEDTLVGIITYKELMNAHPNRIIADAMTEQYLSVSLDESIWDAKDILVNNDTDILLVMDGHKLAGVIDRTIYI
jgi:predicted transcriptional regulator